MNNQARTLLKASTRIPQHQPSWITIEDHRAGFIKTMGALIKMLNHHEVSLEVILATETNPDTECSIEEERYPL